MSSFFTVPGAQKKRKRPADTEGPKKRAVNSRPSSRGPAKATKPTKAAPAPRRRPEQDDDSISGSDSELDDAPEDPRTQQSDSESDGEAETAAEKRLRLAERYLDNIREEADVVGFNAEDVDRDIIAERLRDDVAEIKGKAYRQIAGELDFGRASHCLFRADTLTTTSIATCAPYVYTVSKDQHLIKWKVQDLAKNQYPQTTRKKPKKAPAPPRKRPEKVAVFKGNRSKLQDKSFQGHVGDILCVAASQDGKVVVTGGTDRRLVIYDAKTLRPIKVFQHHRDAVTSLAFSRQKPSQLYSASKDRTVKVWNIEAMAYVETLFGHQDEVVDIDDGLAQERCVTVGARDRTARLWRIIEETQLVFRGGAVEKKRMPKVDPRSIAQEGSMDRIAMIDDQLFVTGSDNGSLVLWSTQKKKPVFILPQAHGLDPALKPEEASAEQHPDPKVVPAPQPRWITALRTIPYSDVILSGSWDGYIRLWRLSEDKRAIEPVGCLGDPTSSALPELNGHSEDATAEFTNLTTRTDSQDPFAIRGIVNDIAVFERGEKGKDGLCVVAATGKEHRLGGWKKKEGKNGAVVFEVPRLEQAALVNGHAE